MVHLPPPAPCKPTNIKTAAECQSDMLITTWDSSEGAHSYTVEAKGNNGETYNCSSPTNSCAISGVPCGEHLSVWMVASNDNCSTGRVLGEAAQTGMYQEHCDIILLAQRAGITLFFYSDAQCFSPYLQFPVHPTLFQHQRSAAKILQRLTGQPVMGLYSTLLLLKLQMEIHTAAIHWVQAV